MGIRRYLDRKNWYSDDVILLFQRMRGDYMAGKLKENHSVNVVDYDNYADSRSFENTKYMEIYRRFLGHGDIGIFAYVDGKCAARCWGVVNPVDVSEGGINLGLEQNAVFVHYVETDRRHRREGLGRECLGKLVEICSGSKMYVTVNFDNIASINLHKSMGFKEIGIIRIKKRFMRQKARLYRMDRV